MRMEQPSIRTILLATISTLALLIVLFAAHGIYMQWQRLDRIQTLKRAMVISDQIFDATEKLAEERDIAYSLLYTQDKGSVADLTPRLTLVRKQADEKLLKVLEVIGQYHFPGQAEQLQQTAEQFLKLQELRKKIDTALSLPPKERDHALSPQWFEQATSLILQTQNLWMDFAGHFSDIDPLVTLHVRLKHVLGIIMEYSGRERSVIGRLIAENADPQASEQAALLQWQGAVDLGWRISATLADQGSLTPAITPYLKDARSHYFMLYNMTRDMFFIPRAGGHGASYPISIIFWLELATQTTDSLYALKDEALRQSGRYMTGLEAEARHRIMMDSVFLLFVLALSLYSFRVVNHRVIYPINAIVSALVRTTKGETVSVPHAANTHDEIGKLTQVLQAVQSNIEEIKYGTARLQSVFDTVLDGLIIINSRGLIQGFNASAERIFGYKAEEVMGQNVKILMPEPYHTEHDSYISNYLRTGTAKIIGIGREVTAKRKDGTIFPMELGINMFQAGGEKAFVGMIRDITARKEAETKLLHYTRALERSNKELDDFAYIASHDLKEPLRGIHNHARFLLEDNQDKLDPDSTARLDRLTYLSQRMEKLVNDLLYFSRLGRQDLAIGKADINAVIHDIENTLDVFMAEHNAHIIIPFPLPAIICDKTRVTELFRNLIINAVKYNDRPEKHVEIGFLEAHPYTDGTMLHNVFYVKDDGRGIAPEFHEEVFRIFKRLQSSKNAKTEGTGVGLTFVKKIVERHNGRIWIASEGKECTTFYFTLGGQHDSRKAGE
ncbi:MAG TPA: PAS domain S-box protein [Rickettsiales bacterium]|nr:PAS domain S-box protein [Rickettsiales bacterium]